MVDGALVLVDAAEARCRRQVVSPSAQARLRPIVVINKVDRSTSRPNEVRCEVFDLFAALDATEEQLDFPLLYVSAKQGWMATSPMARTTRHAAAVRSGAAPRTGAKGSRKARSACSARSRSQIPISARHPSPAASFRFGEAEPGRQGVDPTGKLIEQGRISRCWRSAA